MIGMAMSLDGFVAGPNDSVKQPFGEGGAVLHDWMVDVETEFSGDVNSSHDGHFNLTGNNHDVLREWFFSPSERDAAIIEELRETIGAVVMGRRAYDEGDRNDGFVDNPYLVDHFVLSHDVPETMAEGETTFTFVPDGVESALAQANEAAGAGDVCVMGGAATVQQFLRAELIDEILIHLVPVLLGDGIRLFEDTGPEQIELEPTRVVESSDVTHLWYQVGKVTEGRGSSS